MWTLLRGRRFAEFKFRRQHPFGPYTLDFYCESLKFAVELDGSGHMQPTRSSQDTVRTLFLEQHGLTVLRFWNTDVLKNAAVVLQKLLDVAEKKCQALK